MKISLVNLNLNNIFSIYSLCKKLTNKVQIISNSDELDKNTDIIIIPGVGSFKQGMNVLKKNGFAEKIKEHSIIKKKKLIGICLGMQLLFKNSKEFGYTKGLGLIDGNVDRLPKGKENFPNINWNKINIVNKKSLNKFDKKYFYFIHSYYCLPKEKKIISSYINYNSKNICSSIYSKNIIGMQFHPEKSGENGINFFKKIINE